MGQGFQRPHLQQLYMPNDARLKKLRKVWKTNGLCKLEVGTTWLRHGKVRASAVLEYCPREDNGVRCRFNWTEPDGVTTLFTVSGE